MTADAPIDVAGWWESQPRPLLFIRARVRPGEQADAVRAAFEDEKAALLEDIENGHLAGGTAKGQVVKGQVVALINLIRDIDESTVNPYKGWVAFKVFRGGQAAFIRDLLLDRHDDLLDDLAALRSAGKHDEEDELRWSVGGVAKALQDIIGGMAELAGPDDGGAGRERAFGEREP